MTSVFTTLTPDHIVTWTCITTIIILVIHVIIENIKYTRWKNKIHVGTKLQYLSKIIDDEFDEGYLFTITIIRLGDKQVRVQYSDGSKRTYDKYYLYSGGWKILDETINEN